MLPCRVRSGRVSRISTSSEDERFHLHYAPRKIECKSYLEPLCILFQVHVHVSPWKKFHGISEKQFGKKGGVQTCHVLSIKLQRNFHYFSTAVSD